MSATEHPSDHWQRVYVRTDPVADEVPVLAVGWSGPDLVLSAPELQRPAIGDHVIVSWATGDGVAELVGRVSEVTDGRWRVRPVKPASRVQRRAYTRAGVAAIVVLCGPSGTTRAVMVDISEGGMRCVVRGGTELDAGDIITTTLDLDGEALDVTAAIARRSSISRGRVELAFRFVDLHWRDGDRIRRFVFGRQVRARALED